MELREAELVLAAEIKANTPTGAALVAFFNPYELELYRQSATVADPFLTGKVAGRGEGVNLALKRITQHINANPLHAPGQAR